MKRIVTLLLAAGLMLGASTAAQAVDIKMSGMYDFTAQWANASYNEDAVGGKAGNTHNAFFQRFRTQIDIITSESLAGVLFLEIGDQVWGQSKANSGRGTGGGIGGDGVAIEVRRAYLDWIVPQTDLKIRIGLQGFTLPNMASAGSLVFTDDVAGISASYQFNPTVGPSAWWFRPYSSNINSNVMLEDGDKNKLGNRRTFTDLDMFGVAVPLTFDGVKVTPWGMYAQVGRDIVSNGILDAKNGKYGSSYSGPTASTYISQLMPAWGGAGYMPNASKSSVGAWWAGLTGEVTLWNPFRFAWDMNYGSIDMGHAETLNGDTVTNAFAGKGYDGKLDMKRSGWIVSGLAEYKLDMLTPGLFFWYGSGDDGNVGNGSEMMPSIKGSGGFTSWGQGNTFMNGGDTALSAGLAGTWGIGVQLKDMTFVQDLKHTFRVAYYRGTNDKKMAKFVGSPWNNGVNGLVGIGDAQTYMTEKDSAWEINLENTYNIYKNLQLGVDLGYIKLDLSENAWGKDIKKKEQDAYKIAVGLRYTF